MTTLNETVEILLEIQQNMINSYFNCLAHYQTTEAKGNFMNFSDILIWYLICGSLFKIEEIDF